MCIHTKKLDLLGIYMNWWIGCYPKMRWMTFEDWARQRHPTTVEGTPEYYRLIATNCFYCGKEMKDGTATIDHFIPRAQGGNDDLTVNRYVICCQACNGAKGSMKPETFLRLVRKYLNSGQRMGKIEPKRLIAVYNNLNKVINEFTLNVKNPIYYKVCRKRKKEALFKQAA